MKGCIAVTGTDTGVGKTRVAEALLLAARAHGFTAAGYKPVASGCVDTRDGLRNADAEALLAASSPGLRYEQINPVALAPAIAPHIAAARAGVIIEPNALDTGLDALLAAHDCVVLEGAGGWRVPLGQTQDFADWMARRRLPVLLVVGLKLGAINHALLSAEAIVRAGCRLAWVANHLPEEATGTAAEMRDTLCRRLGPPWLTLAEGEDAAAAARRITPEALSTLAEAA